MALGTLIVAGSITCVHHLLSRSDFLEFWIAISSGFLGMLVLYQATRHPVHRSWTMWILIAMTLRVLLLPGVPTLSDDVYRFLWDGYLLQQGESPFAYTPRIYLADHPDPGWAHLFKLLNSPDYYSVYPPLAQALYGLSASVGSPQSPLPAILLLRIILVAGETGLLILLARLIDQFRVPRNVFWLYAANPLVLLEVSGNLHFEGLVLLALAAMTWLGQRGAWTSAGVLFGLAVSVKLTPLLLAPVLLRCVPSKHRIQTCLSAAMTLGILFFPFLWWSMDHFSQSLDLYFRTFEFNASIYYIIRWISIQFIGYNLIAITGPILAILAGFLILALSLQSKSKVKTTQQVVLLWSLYLWFATTVHPWYLVMPLGLSLLSPWRYPVVWSYLGLLSYSAYQLPKVQEQPILLVVEYGILLLVILAETYWHKQNSPAIR